MHWFRWRFEVCSPLVSAPQADTIFGHVCWALRYLAGEPALEAFLAEYDTTPPLVISEMFPAGWLPMPVCELPDTARAAGKPRLILAPAAPLLAGRLTTTDLRHAMEEAISLHAYPASLAAVTPHNVVDRHGSGTLERGGFYQVREAHYAEGQELEIYFLASSPERAASLLTSAFIGGFGADKSVGRGRIEPRGRPEAITIEARGGRRLALAGFVPRAGECRDLQGVTFTKHGRLGGHFASGINSRIGSHRPFKKPILMFRPGATVEPGDGAWAGCLLGGVHGDTRIRQYAMAPLLPLGAASGNGG